MAQKVSSTFLTSLKQFKFSLLSGFIVVILLGGMLWTSGHKKATLPVDSTHPLPTTTLKQQITTNDRIAYSGEEGIDALTLLKKTASIEQDRSGLVVSINNRKAEATKKEYWSFFINGKMAEVGPADYVTHDNDQLEWKVQAY